MEKFRTPDCGIGLIDEEGDREMKMIIYSVASSTAEIIIIIPPTNSV